MAQQLPQSSNPGHNSVWLDAPDLSVLQDTSTYLPQQNYVTSDGETNHLDIASSNGLSQASISNSFYASSSLSNHFIQPPQQFSTSANYISISTTSPPNVTSVSINELQPHELDVFKNLSLDSYTSHPIQDRSLHHSQEQSSAQSMFLNGYNGNINIQGVHRPRSTSLLHHNQPQFGSRKLSHWHPYIQHSPISISQIGSLDSIGIRQFSAPSSPAASPPIKTVDLEHGLLSPQHRRGASISYDQFDEFNRRYSEGDILSTLVPGLEACLSIFNPEPSATNPLSQATQDLPYSHPVQSPSSSLTISNSGSPDLSSVSGFGSSKGGSGATDVFKCGYDGCSKTFSRLYNLTSHIKSHSNQRPFQCDHCDRQFARLHDKKRHERLHRGVRPFACDRCQHHFARTDALNRHLKVEGGRNLCNMYLIEKKSPKAMPIVEMPPKKINPLILAHFPDFGKKTSEDNDTQTQP